MIRDPLRDLLFSDALDLKTVFISATRIAAASGAWDGPRARVAILGSATLDFAGKAIACAIYREGTYPDLYIGKYGAYVQEVLDPTSDLHAFRPDAIVLAPDWRDVVEGDLDITFFENLWAAADRMGARVYQQTIAPPGRAYRGTADRRDPHSPSKRIDELNAAILESGERVVVVDVERLANEIGLSRWAPERFFVNGKVSFDPAFLPDYMRSFGAAWRLANSRAKKALVLDLDNTLWGGVIGDDGIEGIVLGPGSPAGEAFENFGAYVQTLGSCGVVLAVCSKNDPAIAKAAFAHRHMRLGLNDFAAFVCSWNDKAASLRRIAQELNLGLDALVFADDNPAECALVRSQLPEVAVVELGADPAAFIAHLDRERWFEHDRYTKEDAGRTASYAARRELEVAKEGGTDLPGFLRELRMLGRMVRDDDANLSRLVQMEGKTNQFNLTTRRYDEAALRGFLERQDANLWSFALRDKYADHGVVASVVTVREGNTVRIDSWLMSCRVFSRTAEQFVMARLLEDATASGAERILGEYRPTEKNGVVADLYSRLGFTRLDNDYYEIRVKNVSETDLVTYISPEV